MRLIKNSGNDRVLDELERVLTPGSSIDIATPTFSLFAFAELHTRMQQLAGARLILPDPGQFDLALTGSEADRSSRNKLTTRRWAAACSQWLQKTAAVRTAPAALPQATIVVRPEDPTATRGIAGSCALTTAGLGLTPGNQFSLY